MLVWLASVAYRACRVLLWLDYQLSGPEQVQQCEYRREARITCVRHGARGHRAA